MLLPTQYNNKFSGLLSDFMTISLYKQRESLEEDVYEFYEELFTELEEKNDLVVNNIYSYLEYKSGKFFKHLSIDIYDHYDFSSTMLGLSDDFFDAVFYTEGLIEEGISCISSPVGCIQSLLEDDMFSENILFTVEEHIREYGHIEYAAQDSTDVTLFGFYLTDTVSELIQIEKIVDDFLFKFQRIQFHSSVFYNDEMYYKQNNELLQLIGVVFFTLNLSLYSE